VPPVLITTEMHGGWRGPKGESSLGQCASKETEATLTNEYQARVTALSAAITKQFKVYF
jgi:hypothetical protein